MFMSVANMKEELYLSAFAEPTYLGAVALVPSLSLPLP